MHSLAFIENLEHMSFAGMILIVLGLVMFFFLLLAPFLIIIISHLFLKINAKQKNKTPLPLFKKLKNFFEKMRIAHIVSCLVFLVSVIWFCLFIFGFWGALAGIPIFIALLAIIGESKKATQERGHAVELSGLYCLCGDEMSDVFVVEVSGRKKLLYRECYNCKTIHKG